MKKYMAIYCGTKTGERFKEWNALDESALKEREHAGMKAWMEWGKKHADAIVDNGAPLGKTKRTDASGVSDIKNDIGAYCVVQAESHEEAAKIFENHPHFSIFPGEWVEIMECLDMPEMPQS